MNASRRFHGRLVLVVAIAVVASVIGAAAALGQSSSSSPTTAIGSGSTGSTGAAMNGVAVAGTAVAAPGVVSSGIAAPAWCCGGYGGVPGLTAVGQATVSGQSPDARDAAIGKAVKDATDQANAAAEAAGITLGPIVDLQISAIPFAYPMIGAAGSSPGSTGTGAEPMMPYQSTVSVTITWSLT